LAKRSWGVVKEKKKGGAGNEGNGSTGGTVVFQ